MPLPRPAPGRYRPPAPPSGRSGAVDEPHGEVRAELARRDAVADPAGPVGVPGHLDPQQHVRAAARAGRRAELAARRVAPLAVLRTLAVTAGVDDEVARVAVLRIERRVHGLGV